jgi:hypothetical protein
VAERKLLRGEIKGIQGKFAQGKKEKAKGKG